MDFPFQDNDVNIYKGVNTDWSKVYFQSALTTDIGVSVRGGGKKSNYFLSAGYYDAESTLKGDDKHDLAYEAMYQQRLKIGYNYNTVQDFHTIRIMCLM